MEFDDLVPMLVDTRELAKPVSEEVRSDPVPVSIVTGYLGSGKSTLLKHLTTANHGKKIAIILNEFGDSADIEKSLTISQDDTQVEEWLELDNGCMCCTAKDAGVAAIENLMKHKGKFDYIILETSGIADPAPIASMFWLDDALSPELFIDAVITVVDAKNLAKNLAGDTAKVQLAAADIILLNKVDLVEDTSEAEDLIRSINAASPIKQCTYGQLDPSEVLDIHAFQNLSSVSMDSKPSAKHDQDISTIVMRFTLKDEEALAGFERRLQKLLWEQDTISPQVEIHRIKGRLSVSGSYKLLQGVRETYEIIPAAVGSTWDDEPSVSKVIVIGRGVSQFDQQLKQFLTTPVA